MSELKARKITQEQLLRLLKDSKESNSSMRYGFILGAGTSVKSKIPSGSELAKKWYEIIKEDMTQEQRIQWEKSIGLDEDNLAESYTKIFAKRFEANYQAGYEELQRYMDKAEPSVGYSFLAQLLDETQNKFVITTNFDTMVEDALFALKKSKPMVLGHELLSKYINPIAPSRPTIIKIHRDFLFDPYNTDDDIKELDAQWQEALKPVLSENAMIVIGYGGNDDSLMNYLNEIKDKKLIYWCYREEKDLTPKIKGLLGKNDFVVKINGFDKFMLMLNSKLEFAQIIDKEKIENSPIVKNALNFAKRYEKQLEELAKEELDQEERKAIKKLLPSWWEYQLLVDKENDNDKKEQIYKDGLEAHPHSHELMNNYANLLQKINRDDEAEVYYKKALELDKDDALYNGNYALGLQKLNLDDEAEEYYKKALALEPNHTNNNGNYASLLQKLNRDNEAEKYYKKALVLEPNHADFNGNYAQLLLIQGKQEEAKVFLQKSF
jgi:Tfp pilus assembly protein PilF